jgi:hypothetical protein
MSRRPARTAGLTRLAVLCALLAAAAVVLVAARGGSEPSAAPPGSPDNPLVAETDEAHAGDTRVNEAGGTPTGEPDYGKLLDRQESQPQRRFSPCNLVTTGQARAILGSPIEAPLEAPQGPTCIYRTRSGEAFVTLAVQSVDFAGLRRQLDRRRQVAVGAHAGYCGVHGQHMLYVPVNHGRVLSIAARCSVARRFAEHAVPRLTS